MPVLSQHLLPQGLEPALGAELVAEQGPHLRPLNGAQQDHGLCRQHQGDVLAPNIPFAILPPSQLAPWPGRVPA